VPVAIRVRTVYRTLEGRPPVDDLVSQKIAERDGKPSV